MAKFELLFGMNWRFRLGIDRSCKSRNIQAFRRINSNDSY